MEYSVISFLGGLLTGGVGGAFITAAVTRNLERTKRRRDFRSFLEEWKTEVKNAENTPSGIGGVYFAKAALFRGQHVHIEDCFRRKKLEHFRELSRKLGWITKEDLESKNTDPKRLVLGRINDTI